MKSPKNEGTNKLISRDFLIGLLAIIFGIYNLLSIFGIIKVYVTIPQIVTNILLILAGLFVWFNSFKLHRHKYHTKKMF